MARSSFGCSSLYLRETNAMDEREYTVKLEPVGIEMLAREDESILDAAFRQGLMLMHGCKEGQCASCKAFVLDGEVDMAPYSTFALPDYEEAEGYTLLCRAHAVSDLEVELINFDEEILQSGVAVQTVGTRVESVEALTQDIYRLELSCVEPERLEFHPGQYVDIRIPGTDEHRSFSMANTPSAAARLEFMIKHYPGGHFSGLLVDGKVAAGEEIEIKGPYGVFTLRENSQRRLLFVGGGAGMAPILSLLRALAEGGSTRAATYYYGARRGADLFHLEELGQLAGTMQNFRFVPALSEPDGTQDWSGETGLITEVVDRCEDDLQDVDAYVCGPPPMVDATMALLAARGVPEEHIYYDKFTTTEDPEEAISR